MPTVYKVLFLVLGLQLKNSIAKPLPFSLCLLPLFGLYSAWKAEKDFSKKNYVHEFAGSPSEEAAPGPALRSGKRFIPWCSWKNTAKSKKEVSDYLKSRKEAEIAVGCLARVRGWCGTGWRWREGSRELGHIDRNLFVFPLRIRGLKMAPNLQHLSALLPRACVSLPCSLEAELASSCFFESSL